MSHQIGVFNSSQLNPLLRPAGCWLVLSLRQPWASALFTAGLKQVETRGWRTNYRGTLYIHASAGFSKAARAFAVENGLSPDLPLGCILGSVQVVDVRRTEELQHLPETERAWGDYSPRRYGWILQSPQMLVQPIPAKGMLGLWQFDPELLSPVAER